MNREIYTVEFGKARCNVGLPLHVDCSDGVRITTNDGTEVAMWSSDELERDEVRKVAQNAVWMAQNKPKDLLDQMAHHVISVHPEAKA